MRFLQLPTIKLRRQFILLPSVLARQVGCDLAYKREQRPRLPPATFEPLFICLDPHAGKTLALASTRYGQEV